ncbi:MULTISPECIES: hypothetical protein [Mesorhizobium]|uniref:Uncharacterized protein n=1 Tax=Mesorhizobium onobrychidis TaxID=2775404 RepID=A0ABY5QNW4_9HYPH|nr:MULTISPECIES: hypothetical protein [Mesorhizobium]RWC27958.1 MAG: hypothetical protein EOS70_28280 [Mesorhizobium sp.]TKD47849.1 MAG: hypothetical protein E5W98_04775 [Mesorhizobium sp.]UVC12845.1 hypothetical protein IHQ72_18915 [Mesorhizobium onobrychidis]
MTHRAFAERLEDAAAHISEVSRADLQVMLMNAALRLRNTSGLALEAEVDEAIDLLAAQLKLSRPEVLQTIVRDWLVIAGRLGADTFDEESETEGMA